MKIYLVNTKFQKVECKKIGKGCRGMKFLDISISPADPSEATKRLCDDILSKYSRLVETGDAERQAGFSKGVRNIRASFYADLQPLAATNTITLQLHGALLTLLCHEFEKRMSFKMQMVFGSGGETAPIIIRLSMDRVVVSERETYFLSESDNAWLLASPQGVIKFHETQISAGAASAFEAFMKQTNLEKAVEAAVNDPNIAMELLVFGDKYIMQPLVEVMKSVFKEKLHEWDADVALRLFVMLGKISMPDLKLKVIETIKAKADQLKESQMLPEILQNQELALEFVVLGFRM